MSELEVSVTRRGEHAEMSREELLKRLEHEMTALHMVHEILSSGMWSMEFNDQGEMTGVFWSDEFRAMLGYHDETDFPNVLSSWSDLLHPEDKHHVMEEYYGTIADYTGAKTYDVEYRLLTKNRGWRWFRATGRLSRRADGSPITYVGMFVDITQRKETAEVMEKQRLLLEDALDQAQRASRAKSMFLSNMSHDIRTPMNAIVGFTTLASLYIDDKEMVADYLEKIMAASNELLALLNDVLDMTRIENGEMRIDEKPCPLTAILDELEDMVRSDVRAKGLTLSVAPGPLEHGTVLCDQQRINQVLMNIMSNAIKFTPSGGEISVRLSETPGAPEGYGFYCFRIRDTGIGMNPDFVKRIFEPFERERNTTLSGTQGTGLGMTVTKNMVEMMNGTIRVESEEGKGSEVIVSMQFRLPEEAA